MSGCERCGGRLEECLLVTQVSCVSGGMCFLSNVE